MVLDIKLINTSLKPVFLIRTPDKKNLHLRSLQALLDTGSTKVIWCSTKNDIADTDFEKTGETTTLSGFGIGEQTGCKIYKGSFSIYSTGKGVTFKDIEVVESTKRLLHLIYCYHMLCFTSLNIHLSRHLLMRSLEGL